MKKTLIIALAGIVMFAFTQCGGGASSGSKEYQDNIKMFKELEKSIKDTKTRDELGKAILSSFFMTNNNEYADDEKMTKEEEAEIIKLGESFEELINKQTEKLGCEKDDIKLF